MQNWDAKYTQKSLDLILIESIAIEIVHKK